MICLKQEFDLFNQLLPELLAHEGKYVLIKASEVSILDTNIYSQALTEGYTRYGLQPFLIKQIKVAECVTFTRNLLRP